MTTPWIFALGLLVGFLAGIALDDAFDLYRASRKERRMKTSKPTRGTILGVVLSIAVLLQLGVGVLIIVERAARQEYADCTTRWQQSFAAAYQSRIESSTAASDALEAVIRAVDAEQPDRFREAVDDYLLLRDRQIKDQKRNPYPPLPDELCGEKP